MNEMRELETEHAKKKPKCPQCSKDLCYVESALYTGSNPSVHPFIPPHWRCDACRIGSYNLKTWYDRRGIIKVEGRRHKQ